MILQKIAAILVTIFGSNLMQKKTHETAADMYAQRDLSDI